MICSTCKCLSPSHIFCTTAAHTPLCHFSEMHTCTSFGVAKHYAMPRVFSVLLLNCQPLQQRFSIKAKMTLSRSSALQYYSMESGSADVHGNHKFTLPDSHASNYQKHLTAELLVNTAHCACASICILTQLADGTGGQQNVLGSCALYKQFRTLQK